MIIIKNNKKENKGWICLHRKLLDNPIARKPEYLAVWIYLLLTANHAEQPFIWKGKKRILKEGQLITNLREISENTGVNKTKVHRIIQYFAQEKQIETHCFTHFSLITVINWGVYQEKRNADETQYETLTTPHFSHATAINRNTSEKNETQNETLILPKTEKSETLRGQKSLSNKKNSTPNNVNNINNINNIYIYDDELKEIVDHYNRVFSKKITSTEGFKNNYLFWSKIHSKDKIKLAISNAAQDKFWKDKLTLTILFRKKNPRGENVDYIEDLSSRTVSNIGNANNPFAVRAEPGKYDDLEITVIEN